MKATTAPTRTLAFKETRTQTGMNFLTVEKMGKLTRGDVEAFIKESVRRDCLVDLSGKDLSGLDLSRLDLSMANLSGANLYNTFLRWANLSGANLEGADVTYTKLNGTNLMGVDLRKAKGFEEAENIGMAVYLTTAVTPKQAEFIRKRVEEHLRITLRVKDR